MNYNRLARYMMLDEGYNINFNDIGHISHIQGSYRFDIVDKNYIVKFYNFDNGDYEVKFGINSGGTIKDIDMTNDMTVSLAKEVMVNVAKCIVLFIKQRTPRSVKYITDRRSKEKQYRRLVNILMSSRLFNYHLEHYNGNIHYIIKDGYSISDVIT